MCANASAVMVLPSEHLRPALVAYPLKSGSILTAHSLLMGDVLTGSDGTSLALRGSASLRCEFLASPRDPFLHRLDLGPKGSDLFRCGHWIILVFVPVLLLRPLRC